MAKPGPAAVAERPRDRRAQPSLLSTAPGADPVVPSNPQDPQETSHSEQGISEVLLWGLKPLHRASFKPLWAGRNMARGHSWCGLVVQSPLTAWQLGSNKVPGMGWCQDHRAACPGTPRAPSTATAQPSPVVPTETSVPGRDLPADPICCGCEPDHNRVRCSRGAHCKCTGLQQNPCPV